MAERQLVSVSPEGRAYRVEYTVGGKPRYVQRIGSQIVAFNFLRVVGRSGLSLILSRKRSALETMDSQNADYPRLAYEVEEMEWLLSQLPEEQ